MASNPHATRVYDSILGLLSSEENPTPLVRLHRVVPFRQAQIYAKLEWYNPFGAVKDRVAANLIRAATHRPKPRRKTRPSAAAKRRRLETKRRQGETKRSRSGKLDFT